MWCLYRHLRCHWQPTANQRPAPQCWWHLTTNITGCSNNSRSQPAMMTLTMTSVKMTMTSIMMQWRLLYLVNRSSRRNLLYISHVSCDLSAVRRCISAMTSSLQHVLRHLTMILHLTKWNLMQLKVSAEIFWLLLCTYCCHVVCVVHQVHRIFYELFRVFSFSHFSTVIFACR